MNTCRTRAAAVLQVRRWKALADERSASVAQLEAAGALAAAAAAESDKCVATCAAGAAADRARAEEAAAAAAARAAAALAAVEAQSQVRYAVRTGSLTNPSCETLPDWHSSCSCASFRPVRRGVPCDFHCG